MLIAENPIIVEHIEQLEKFMEHPGVAPILKVLKEIHYH